MSTGIPNLIYVSDQEPGYTRIENEDGFIYIDEQELQLSEKKVIKRIKNLVIPPIWKDVWICKNENGHLQSTGRDGKNRKQYIYHPLWTAHNQKNKFSKLEEFGLALPKLRKQIEADLEKTAWSKRKVLALVVHLLDEYFLRVGNSFYTNQNDSYGITTLRRKHLDATKESISLEYKAKSNRVRKIDITNKKLAKLVREISELPGYEIFRYKEKNQTWSNVDSADVNHYIQQQIGSDFSAKDFRTWGGTKLAIALHDKALQITKENKRRQFEPTLVRLIAQKLGNKLSTCREYYVHPAVLSAAEQHDIPERSLVEFQNSKLDKEEQLVLTLLKTS